ncbi:5-formyltetrahydrofolate cyclo-ligase [Arthrobacter glacialis]|uniref:5-formyltetrahydrofolate cyclo-ligase n=1 Tax=Arthrobacter glacialis TaxID=1664 RepID=A0A2S3ZXY0_ARTGL|nr:5-formyltetrahydrofolate cyclo-ligase [Arthrobacter glacialis]POH74070.1 5-formyltetrahydrofolate cyclo-ligase [Arthrobacter glacialis]
MSTMSKAEWRAQIRAQRQSVAPAAGPKLARVGLDWLASLDMLAPAAAGMTACAYVSMGHEPPTAPLLEAWTAAGHTVYVPVCEPEYRLSWTLWHPGIQMAKSPLAPVMEPVGPRLSFAALGSVEAILIPALAVDTAGVRLGQGGGYYDRFLATIPALPVAAVVYAHELVAPGLLPHDFLDARVTHALTPAGYQRCGPPLGNGNAQEP